MKRLTYLICFFVLFSIGSGFTQSSEPDSLRNEKTIRITPNQADTDVNALGNFAVTAKDSLAFQIYAGQSVLNALRGHVPNLASGPSSFAITPGLRSGSSMFIIDGLPFNNRIDSYVNLKSFEYQNIYAISGASATQFGGLASNGAIFLESKSGKGFHKPTFEFNSAPSFTWTGGGSEVRYDQWFITNAVAYQQDFGKVDTRLSYTFNHIPASDDYMFENRSNYHSIKLNTGVDVTDRFNIRLIVDENRSINTYESFYNQSNQEPVPYETQRKVNSLQGNLTLRYQLFDWLLLSSQSSITRISDLSKSTLSNIPESSGDYERKFANFFTSLDLPIAGRLSVNAFAGLQLEKQEGDWRQFVAYNGGSAGNSYYMESNTRAYSGGIGFQYDNSFFINYNYRLDRFSEFPDDDNTEPTYSLTSSFVFSEAFHWSNRWFSLGKLRGSFGKAFYIDAQSYPFANPSPPLGQPFGQGNPSTLFRPQDKRNNEVGLDLGFFNNRITLQATSFYDVNEQAWVVLAIPSGWNGTTYGVFNIGSLRTKGWEFVLGTTPIAKNNLTMNTKFIIGAFDTKIKSNLPSGNNTGTTIIPFNPNPDWRGSLLNQLTWKKIFFSFLIDVRKGGDVLMGMDLNSPNTLIIEDGTFAKLRDVSIGYGLSAGRVLRQVNVSVSGRNIWTIYSKTKADVEGMNTNQKGIAASLTLIF